MRKNPHVRICGGLGSATTLVYPTLLTTDSSRLRSLCLTRAWEFESPLPHH